MAVDEREGEVESSPVESRRVPKIVPEINREVGGLKFHLHASTADNTLPPAYAHSKHEKKRGTRVHKFNVGSTQGVVVVVGWICNVRARIKSSLLAQRRGEVWKCVAGEADLFFALKIR